MQPKVRKGLVVFGVILAVAVVGVGIWLIVKYTSGGANTPAPPGPTGQPRPSPILTVTPPPHPTVTPLPPGTWVGLPNFKATGQFVKTEVEGPVYSGGWNEARGAGAFAMAYANGGGAYLGGLVLDDNGAHLTESDHTTFEPKNPPSKQVYDQLAVLSQGETAKHADVAVFTHQEEGNSDRLQGEVFYRATDNSWHLDLGSSSTILDGIGQGQYLHNTVYQPDGTLHGVVASQGDPSHNVAQVSSLSQYTYDAEKHVLVMGTELKFPGNDEAVYLYGLSSTATYSAAMVSTMVVLYAWDNADKTYKLATQLNASGVYVYPDWPTKNEVFNGVALTASGDKTYISILTRDSIKVLEVTSTDLTVRQTITYDSFTPAMDEPNLLQTVNDTLLVSQTGQVTVMSMAETVSDTKVYDVEGAQVIAVSNERGASSVPFGYAHSRGLGNMLLPDSQNRLQQWEWVLGSKTS